MKLLLWLLVPALAFGQSQFDYNTQLKNQPLVLSDRNTTYTTFFQACTAAGSTKTLIVSKVWTSVANGTCAANLQFVAGGMIQPRAGNTVTLTGTLTAPLAQIFDLSLAGTVVPGPTPAYYPQWWGAKGDGSTDGTAAVQAAIDAASAGSTVHFTIGTYLMGAITLKSEVALTCLSGTIFNAKDNNEIMFNTGSGVNRTGLTGSGGYCTINSNGKTGFQAVAILARGGFSTNNTYRNLLISAPAIGIQTQGTFFNLFENIRVLGPTVGAYLFEAETTTTYCTNCSAIATVGTPIGFTIHNGNGFVFTGGTFEGTLQNSVYQTGQIVFNSTYFENGGAVVNAYVTIGTSATNVTQSVDFQGCFFNSGANYALDIYQAEGLVVNGSTIQTNTAAYQIEPNAAPTSADRLKRGLQISNNTFNVGVAGFNPATIFSFGGNPVNDLSSNVSMDQINPLKFSGSVIGGSVLVPQAASMTTGEGTLYIDPTTGILGYRYKDGAAAIQNGVSVGAKCYYFRPGVIDSSQSICWADANTGLLDGPVITGFGGVRLVDRAGTVAQFGGWDGATYLDGKITFPLIPGSYANNAAALGAGLTVGMLYRSGDALNIVH